MSANLRQHGGTHYMMKQEYQHWDWVTDIGLHYLLACASKYVSRWKDKGGTLDLQKAAHYLDKAEERAISRLYPAVVPRVVSATTRFIAQLPENEGEAIMDIVLGNYASAKKTIEALITDAVAEARALEQRIDPVT